jgi:hypothetical protein
MALEPDIPELPVRVAVAKAVTEIRVTLFGCTQGLERL